MKRFSPPRFITSLFGLSLGVPTLLVALFYILVLFRFDGTCVTFTAEASNCGCDCAYLLRCYSLADVAAAPCNG